MVPILLTLLAVVAVLGWLAVAPMPVGKTKKSFGTAVVRFSRAYVFGGLLGAFYGAAMCPDHFSMKGQFQFVGVHALIGMAIWGCGSLVLSRLTPRAHRM